MIEFIRVTKKYLNDVVALQNVSFKIEQGEFVFLIGPSGAGKSTLIKLILHEESADKGRVILDGKDITSVRSRHLPAIHRKVGVVFQDFRLLEDRTVYDNVGFVMDIQGRSPREKKRRIPEMLELVGLANKAKSFPNQLSGGEQQRTSIARAMVGQPEILIADEPTGNLDPETSREILDALSAVNQRGTTVIVSTHAKEIVDAMRRRVLQLDRGILVRDELEGEYDNR